MNDTQESSDKPFLLEVPIVSLDPRTLRARIWEEAGLDICENDPLYAAQVIYVAAMEDQARLLDLQANRMNKIFSDNLEIFHSETESIVLGIKEEISSQAISERMTVMSDQIKQADTLAASISRSSRLFKILTIINLLSIIGAVSILFYVFK